MSDDDEEEEHGDEDDAETVLAVSAMMALLYVEGPGAGGTTHCGM